MIYLCNKFMVTVIYSFFIFLYQQVIRLAALFNLKARLLQKGQRQTFDMLRQKLISGKRYIWVHAASLGEFEQGRPVMERLKQQHPDTGIILTFFSPSGYEAQKNCTVADIVCYLPVDRRSNAQRFIMMINPVMAIFIKYEFWANYLQTLHQKAIPTCLISAAFRPSQLFFKPYGGWYRKLLHCFTHLFVQDEPSARLLQSINIQNITIAGDTRFDRVTAIADQAKELPLVAAFAHDARTWIAGSSWSADEKMLIACFNHHPEIKMIIAPHITDESHVNTICRQISRPYIRYTQATIETALQAECLIIDCIGLLSSIYRYGEMAYIGGGFGAGIHNVLEAAVYGIPVIFGPNYHKSREASHLIERGGGFSVVNQNEFNTLTAKLLQSHALRREAGNNAREFVYQQCGATNLIIQNINTLNETVWDS